MRPMRPRRSTDSDGRSGGYAMHGGQLFTANAPMLGSGVTESLPGPRVSPFGFRASTRSSSATTPSRAAGWRGLSASSAMLLPGQSRGGSRSLALRGHAIRTSQRTSPRRLSQSRRPRVTRIWN